MKQGLVEGQTVTLEIKVTPDMFAQFDGKIVHRAYSTVSMIYHMEWASRQIILPFLEEHEEGMGGAVQAKHLFPTPEGATLTITAQLCKYEENSILTEVTVKNGESLVGIGEVKQIILPKSKISSLLA